MISSRCFTLEWIKQKRKDLTVKDPGILEKSIHALALLSHLAESRLTFIFKGGTSLLLHLPQIRRLSIDIDIVCGAEKKDLDLIVQSISKKAPFIGHEEDDRGFQGLPNRRHFKFFFNSQIGKKETLFILLDVVEEPECRLPLTTKRIITPFIEIENETVVTIPTVEGLFGDKLTAFAPNTIGVPFENRNGVSQTMQVAKQLFDLGELFNHAENISGIADGFYANFKKENHYRGGKYTFDEVLNDTIRTCRNFCGMQYIPENDDTRKLRDGTARLSSHLVGRVADLNAQMKIAAAKALLVASTIKNGNTGDLLIEFRYDKQKIQEIAVFELTGEFAGLTRLKNTNPEAFYYLLRANRLTM